MKKRGMAVSVVSFFLFLLLSGLSSCEKTQAQQTGDPSSTVTNQCTVCHSTERICDNLGKKDKQEWRKTVTRMADYGAKVDPQNIPAVADFLAGLKPGSKPVCK